MDKGVGFNRNIRLAWMDEVASLRLGGCTHEKARNALDAVLGGYSDSPENRRKTTDVLVNIWYRSEALAPGVYAGALDLYASTSLRNRVWLHYGLTLVAYPYFRSVAGIVGRQLRQEGHASLAAVKRLAVLVLGNVGATADAVSRVVFTLRDWGLLAQTSERHRYVEADALGSEDTGLQTWLLACALTASGSESLPLLDLLRLPELFPFRFTVGLDALRRSTHFLVERQGGGWDAVRMQTEASGPRALG
jgi:hypothetical protein